MPLLTLLVFSFLLLGLARPLCGETVAENTSVHHGECVVLLHGLGRWSFSMNPVARSLERAGYRVVSVNYPSWRVPVERLADEHLHRAVTQRVPPGTMRVHFVTHSFGGILLRQYPATHSLTNLGRVIMLGPPNHGTDFVDRWLRHEPLRWLAGPNLSRLGTGPDDLPARLGPVNFELGVIAGDSPWLGVTFGRETPNDGKVSLASVKIEGMKDFAVVHCSHTFIMRKREVLEQASHFLEHGIFAKTAK